MDKQAFISFCNRIRNPIFRFALKMLRQREDAEDVVQEVLIRVWKNRHKLTAYNSVDAFAMLITRNLCLDRIRTSKTMVPEELIRYEVSNEGVSITEGRNILEIIRKEMNKLPEIQSGIMHLRDIEGYEFEEIAEIMNMKVNAVRVNLSRARKHIRNKLKERYHYEQS